MMPHEQPAHLDGSLSSSPAENHQPADDSRWRQIFGVDLRSLAAMRIGVALLLLVDLIQRSGDLTAHYTDFGTMPRSIVADRVADSPWCLSLHMMAGVAPVEAALFFIAGACAFLLLIGFRTKLMTLFSWFLLMSLHHRNPMILQGGDVLLRMMLLFGVFLPLGAKWSIDSVVWPSPPRARRLFCSCASAALMLQISFVYIFSVLLKTDPVWWRDFTAVYCALSLDHFVTPFGKLLLPHSGLLKVLTVNSLVIEGLAPLAALVSGLLKWPFRTGLVAGMMLFHLGMGLCLELGLFSWICSAAWLVFLPAGFWNWLDHEARNRLSDLSTQIVLRKEQMHRTISVSGLSGAIKPWTTYSLNPSRWNHAAAIALILYVFLWNVRTLNNGRVGHIFPPALNWVAWLTGTGQVWDMFSPSPLREGGWFVMPAQLADGSQVDLFRKGAEVDWSKPALVSSMYKNDRWRKYLVILAAAANSDRRLPYAQWLAREWNAHHPPEKQILTFQIFLMRQNTLPNYKRDTPTPVLLWLHDCRPAVS